jgi:hypothetical protein
MQHWFKITQVQQGDYGGKAFTSYSVIVSVEALSAIIPKLMPKTSCETARPTCGWINAEDRSVRDTGTKVLASMRNTCHKVHGGPMNYLISLYAYIVSSVPTTFSTETASGVASRSWIERSCPSGDAYPIIATDSLGANEWL